jgi:shikimate dehydrogenase
MALSGSTKLAGVMGWPVAHSRSPLLHNTWLAHYGIDGAYVPLPVAPADFATAVRGLRAAGFRGVNVTVPHKEAALAVCDSVDDSARRAGAVNTLVFGPAGVHGSCTDGTGFLANLAAHGVDVANRRALLLGAGGAARAIAAALLDAGVAVTVANRTPARAAALAEALPGLRVLGWQDRGLALGDFELLVNASAGGMPGGSALDHDLARAAPGLAVADIVYVPMQTDLLRAARAHGLVAVGGLGMLLHQAVPGFAAWFGVTPAVDETIAALVSADIPVS